VFKFNFTTVTKTKPKLHGIVMHSMAYNASVESNQNVESKRQSLEFKMGK